MYLYYRCRCTCILVPTEAAAVVVVGGITTMAAETVAGVGGRHGGRGRGGDSGEGTAEVLEEGPSHRRQRKYIYY